MADMIDMDSLLARAKAGSDFLSAPSFQLGMGAARRPAPGVARKYEGDYRVGAGGFSLGALPQPPQPQEPFYGRGGEGGEYRSYVPAQDMANVIGRGEVPPTAFGDSAPEPEQEATDTDVQRQKVERMANGTIPQLLEALRMMASMEPGAPSNPVFQLDAQYKNSDAMTGIPGTVAQYPTAGGITRETDFSL